VSSSSSDEKKQSNHDHQKNKSAGPNPEAAIAAVPTDDNAARGSKQNRQD